MASDVIGNFAGRFTSGRVRRLTAAVLGCALILTLVGSARSAAELTASTPATTLPPIKLGQDSGVLTDGNTLATKARSKIQIPLTMLRLYANDDYTFIPPLPFSKELITRSPSWVVSPPGSPHAYGDFPVIRTAILGFGAIPVTADVHLSQLFHGTTPDPIMILAQGPTTFPSTVPTQTTITGQVDMRISDVAVDKVPLDVGSNCHTVTPLNLKLIGDQATYNLVGGGLLSGVTTIPRFVGCHSGSEDLDPLLSGTISGPNNPVTIYQGTLGNWNGTGCTVTDGCTPPPK